MNKVKHYLIVFLGKNTLVNSLTQVVMYLPMLKHVCILNGWTEPRNGERYFAGADFGMHKRLQCTQYCIRIWTSILH
jgi:hypothetical protein